MRLALLNPVYDPERSTPEATLERFDSLRGWAEAVRDAGADRVTVVQRFPRDVDLERGGIHYAFRRDGAGPVLAPWRWPGGALHELRELRPDVVHAHGLAFFALPVELRVTLPARTRVVVQDHGGRALRTARDPLRRAAMRIGLAAADAFLFTSAEDARPWRAARLFRPGQRVFAVPEASRAVRRESRDEARARTGARGRPEVLFVGRLNDNKDPLTVLRGFAAARADLPEARLTMAYLEDDRLSDVQRFLDATPALRGCVELLGRLPLAAMPERYAAADVFVSGSHYESAGFALLEALGQGVLPVVTDIPSHRAFTDEGALGALFSPGDADGLRRGLVRTWKTRSDDHRDRIRAWFERELSWSAVGRRALAIYESVVRA